MATRNCLVTGAKGGIGSAVVDMLTERGWRVFAWDLPEHDVTDARSITEDIANLELQHGPLQGLVHTAGILRLDSPLHPSITALQACTNVNFYGTVNTASCVARSMVSRGQGSIVVVSSNSARTPRVEMTSYGASKAAVTTWAQSLGLECAQKGVRVNMVSPGSTQTPMLEGMWDGADNSSAVIAGNPEQFRLGIPLDKLARPEDVAASCAFLLSDEASHITMHDLRVDGGATLDS